jgi:hypothetical protein
MENARHVPDMGPALQHFQVVGTISAKLSLPTSNFSGPAQQPSKSYARENNRKHIPIHGQAKVLARQQRALPLWVVTLALLTAVETY